LLNSLAIKDPANPDPTIATSQMVQLSAMKGSLRASLG
jgi:hypothetical protein